MQSPAAAADLDPLLDEPRFEILPLPEAAEEALSLPADGTVTVTCSPSRGLEATLALTEELAAAGWPTVPHLAARQIHDEVALKDVVRRLEAAGVSEVFVVGGDLPSPVGDFDSGLALLEALAELGADFDRVGVPAYPEGHPHMDEATILAVLRAKQPYADYLVTQLSFDPAAIVGWLRTARRAGVSLPAYVGLPGVVDRVRLARIAVRIGVGDSVRFLTRHRGLGRRLGRRTLPDELVGGLAAQLVPDDHVVGVHLYTFNRVGPTAAWLTSARR